MGLWGFVWFVLFCVVLFCPFFFFFFFVYSLEPHNIHETISSTFVGWIHEFD